MGSHLYNQDPEPPSGWPYVLFTLGLIAACILGAAWMGWV
jgi:hypothetical protein